MLVGRRAAVVVLSLRFLHGATQPPASEPPTHAVSSAKSGDPLNRDSPQNSVFAFLEACRSHDYLRAAKYLDLRKLPRTERSKDGGALAQQLGQILDRDPQFEVAELSRDPEGSRTGALSPDRERVDSFTVDGRTLDLELVRVPLRSGLSIWLFSANSVDHIPQLARMTSDSPVERHLPEPMIAWSFLDTSLWRWIALVLLAALVGGLSRLLSPFVLRLVEPVLKRIVPRANWSLLESFLAPLRLLLAVGAFRAGLEWIEPSARVRFYLERGAALLFFLGLAWLCMRIVDLIIGRLATVLSGKHRAFSHSVLPLTSRVVKITILLLMVAAVLGEWGYNTTTIVAGLGVGGIAIALAAQKTIENFFGGVAVVSDRPVAVGDFCKFGDRMGTIEDIGLRSTRIRTLDRTLVTVPNGLFSAMTLENLDRRDKMLFHFTLSLRRDTKPDQVRTLLASITKTLTEHRRLETGPLPVRFVGVGTYSLDLEIFAYVLTRDGDEFMQIQQDLYLWILDAVETAGTALALPTQASVSYAYGSALPNAPSAPLEAVPADRR
jgi:MscS family membrane protein